MALRGWRQIKIRSFVGYRISDLFQVASYIGLLPSYDDSAHGLGSDTQLCLEVSKHRVAYGWDGGNLTDTAELRAFNN